MRYAPTQEADDVRGFQDEVFFSSTSGGIIPIAVVDGRPVADGQVGPITRRIRRAYLDLLAGGTDGLRVS